MIDVLLLVSKVKQERKSVAFVSHQERVPVPSSPC